MLLPKYKLYFLTSNVAENKTCSYSDSHVLLQQLLKAVISITGVGVWFTCVVLGGISYQVDPKCVPTYCKPLSMFQSS